MGGSNGAVRLAVSDHLLYEQEPINPNCNKVKYPIQEKARSIILLALMVCA